ncbi:MAG: DUF790 family protein [Kofleriaceae bacterium]|nr:DUF790 family protein [Kofleriaceae bacterium]
MLTADLVQVRRRSGNLEIPAFSSAQVRSLGIVAEQLISVCKSLVGQSSGTLLAQWDALTERAGYPKQVRGLRKLLLDRCSFEDGSDVVPREIRNALFTAAAKHRYDLEEGEIFSRTDVLTEASALLNLPSDAIESGLFSDLKENHLLVSFDSLAAVQLVRELERAQRQAVLLRAVRVTVTLRSSSAAEYRLFFQRLKFRQLLHTITPLEGGGYEIQIDGPYSLFQSVTKYGLQLALMLPILEGFPEWELDAEIAWGVAKERYGFHLSGACKSSVDHPRNDTVSEEVSRLREQFAKLGDDWQVRDSTDLLELSGTGLCVPDLRFEHNESGQVAYLEVMGFWSRAAVWKRVELVESGLSEAVIFTVGRRLRVSEEVLSDDLPSQIYVYKGVISAKEILRRLEGIRAATPRSKSPILDD